MSKQIGVQPGTSATSIQSKELDDGVKVVSEAIKEYLKWLVVPIGTVLLYERGHSNAGSREKAVEKNRLQELSHLGDTIGVVPDGGMWFERQPDGTRKLLAAFEAKYQGKTGNAYERWNKNFMVCEYINPAVKYVTFMTGEGAVEGNVLHSFGTTMHKIKPNAVFYYSPGGFSREEIFGIFKSTLGLSMNYQDLIPFIGQVDTHKNKQRQYFNTLKQKKLAPTVLST